MTAEKLGKLNSNGFIFYSGKGGGKRTADNQSQEQLPNPPAPPDFNGEDTKEETANNSLSAAAAGGGGGLNSQNQAASRFWPQGMNAAGVPAGTSIDFATWSRYRMGRHKT